MIKFLFIVIIEIIILYVGIRFLHIYNDEKEKDNDARLHEIEKRLGEIEIKINKIKKVIK